MRFFYFCQVISGPSAPRRRRGPGREAGGAPRVCAAARPAALVWPEEAGPRARGQGGAREVHAPDRRRLAPGQAGGPGAARALHHWQEACGRAGRPRYTTGRRTAPCAISPSARRPVAGRRAPELECRRAAAIQMSSSTIPAASGSSASDQMQSEEVASIEHSSTSAVARQLPHRDAAATASPNRPKTSEQTIKRPLEGTRSELKEAPAARRTHQELKVRDCPNVSKFARKCF